MNNLLIYISVLILGGCEIFEEQTTLLPGDYYIEDGWQAFTSQKYDEAESYFMIAIETNKKGSIYHFESSVGLGWTHLYKAFYLNEINPDELVKSSGNHLNTAISILVSHDISPDINSKMNLYAGLTYQHSYWAKQIAANGIYWETENVATSDTIRYLYQASINYSKEISTDFIFQYDSTFTYNNITLIIIENYILIGDIDNAVSQLIEYEEFSNFKCSETVNTSSIIACLCEATNNGTCPFQQE